MFAGDFLLVFIALKAPALSIDKKREKKNFFFVSRYLREYFIFFDEIFFKQQVLIEISSFLGENHDF